MGRFVLLNLKTSGLKSLEHDIELQFYNHNLKEFEYKSSLVKAIYGTNGEGKTAIAHTLELYRNSVINGDYLAAQSFNGSFQELINQHSKKIFIDLYFAFFNDEKSVSIFHHIIEYKLKDDRIYVSHELISECKNLMWGNKENEVLLFETKEGEIIDIYPKMDEKYKKEILDQTRNLLTNSSCAFSILVNTHMLVEDYSKKNDITSLSAHAGIMYVILFALSLNVFIDKEDRVKVSTDRIDAKIRFKPFNSMQISDSDDEINVFENNAYIKQIKRIEKLLKVFKPDLDRIEIKSSDARGNKLVCTKTLVYKNGDKVNLLYESTGIKKLVRIFNALSSVENGGVVFIDEFDANIHDVYLCKLVEYFLEYTNGQFIFTTHNLGPMEVLDKKGLKHSIDFINKQKVTPWRRNGNYSVVNVYRNGMIPNSPFNINSVDFIKVFGGGKKNE